MPDDSKKTGGQIAAASIPIIGQGINAIIQGAQNRKARKFAEKMYARQRADALADWNMQNEYNSPMAQMARFRDAGLNPNLMYGQGSGGEAGNVRSSDTAHWRPEAAQFDTGAALSAYYSTRLQDANLVNLEKQGVVLDQQAANIAADTVSKTFGVESGRFDLGLKTELRQTSIDAAQAALEKVRADTKFTLDSNERAMVAQSSSLLEAAERILRSRAERAQLPAQRQLIYAQIASLKKDEELKAQDLKLKQNGIQPTDNMLMRILSNGSIPEKVTELRNKYGLKLGSKFVENFKKWKMNPLPWK